VITVIFFVKHQMKTRLSMYKKYESYLQIDKSAKIDISI